MFAPPTRADGAKGKNNVKMNRPIGERVLTLS
jgi:hypothetical protein